MSIINMLINALSYAALLVLCVIDLDFRAFVYMLRNKKNLINKLNKKEVIQLTVLICKGCGKQTNTVCCHHHRGNPPDYCYAAWDTIGEKWIKGCGFDKAGAFDKAFAMHMITGKTTESFLSKKEVQ